MPSARRRVALLWLLPVSWAGLLWHLSSLSADQLVVPPIVGWDKVAHLAAYAVLSLLLVRALDRSGAERGRAAAIAVLLAGLYGVVDELHQGWFPERNRSCSEWDALADVLGAALAAGLWAYWKGRRAPAGGAA